MTSPTLSPFLSLPPELILHILEFLPPQELSVLSTTCHLLHTHGRNETLWAHHVRCSVPITVASPAPCSTWRELYIAHHPFWFLPRYKIWFADRDLGGNTMTGNLILARYDPRRGCIEAYRLVAEHGMHTFESWDWRPEVIIHTFNPKVSLHLDDPVVQLVYDPERQASNLASRLKEETPMQTGTGRRTSKISLCQAIPPALQHPSMALWPPRRFPAKHRSRCESSTMFRDAAHKPHSLAQASDQTFRIRRYLDLRGMERHAGVGYLGARLGEDVLTFSTLLEESYAATEEKPWQGIFVGDYSGHGCEFLLVLQKSVDPAMPPIRASTWSDTSSASSAASISENGDENLDLHDLAEASLSASAFADPAFPLGIALNEEVEDNPIPSCRGRLEAIKLTGDPNVPRGEFTWIAEDIGPKGFIRNAEEQMFKGARVVRSLGHCAARNFKHDKFVASQLIMIDFDTLAQYWEDFGHISFYKRVDIQNLLHV